MHHTRTLISTADPFDMDAVKLHARVDGTHDDAALAMMARAAAREIEAHAELALLWQNITLELDRWDDAISLPIGPFSKAAALLYDVTIQTRADDGTLTDFEEWEITGTRKPRLHLLHPTEGTALVITYPAGFGDTADSIPADLQLAIMDQAARSYDVRGAEDGPQGLSLAASRITARYRRVAV